MWNCLKCFNESEDSAEYCGYCGSPRSASLENAREIATRSAKPGSHNARTLTPEDIRQYPLNVPFILRLPESAVRVIAAVVGVLGGLICSAMIYFLSDPSGMTGRLFNLRQLSAAVPVSTLTLFFWGLSVCSMRWLRTGAAKRLSADRFLFHSIEVAKLGGLSRLVVNLEMPVTAYSPLLRRIRAVTAQWSIKPGLQDADVLLQQQMYSDEDRVRAGYSLVRTFIWALPVVGLLGTVAGVASAVGGFAEFLRGDIEDVSVIKVSLVGVTSGLSYAFLATLYGLATALVLMLIAAALQNREQKLYSTIQEKMANVFLPFLQTIAPESKADDTAMPLGLKEELIAISASVMDYVRQQAAVTLRSFSEERNALREDVIDWSKLLREEAMSGASDIGEALEQVAVRMSNAQFEFLQKFEALKSGMDQQVLGQLESLSAATQSTLAGQQQIAGEIVRVVESQRKQLETSMAALNQTSALVTTLLTAQESLHDSVEKLQNAGFDETLREFRDSLTALKPVLENLREPFILQAVPIKANGTT